MILHPVIAGNNDFSLDLQDSADGTLAGGLR